MKIKIEAATRLLADAASWFQSLSKEQQDQYLELHPASKYGDQKGTGHDDEKPAAKPGKVQPKKKSPHGKTPKQVQQVKEFAASEEAEPNSKPRRTFGQMIKGKLKGIVHHIKDEVAEAAVAGRAVTKVFAGKKLNDKDMHALKATAVRLVLVCGSLAVTGGLTTAIGHGVSILAQEIAHDFVQHSIVSASEKTLMHSSTTAAADDEDKGLDKMAELFAHYMATSPNVQKILAKAE